MLHSNKSFKIFLGGLLLFLRFFFFLLRISIALEVATSNHSFLVYLLL